MAGACASASVLIADAPSSSDAARIDLLIRQLGSDEQTERDAASSALLAMGRPVLKALRKASTSNDAEVRSRSNALIETIDPDGTAVRRLAHMIELDEDRRDEPVAYVQLYGDLQEEDLAHLEHLDRLVKV